MTERTGVFESVIEGIEVDLLASLDILWPLEIEVVSVVRLGEETRLLLEIGSLVGVVITLAAELEVDTVIERLGLVCAVAFDLCRLDEESCDACCV